MIVTKGEIISLPQIGDNHFQVRVYFLEDNTQQEFIIPALLCCPPGYYGGYKEGDRVFLTFENDVLNMGIILGKLYINDEDTDIPNKVIINNLQINNTANLPKNVSVGGYGAADLFIMDQQIQTLQDTVDSLPINYEVVPEE